jgi:non-specific serine/threonine protein kinase
VRQVGDQHTRADVLRLLGLEQLRHGNHEQARALIEEALTHSSALKDTQSIALLLHILAVAALGVDDDERAHELLLESLQLQDELGQKLNSAKCLGTLAVVAVRQGRYERAARLLGAVAALLKGLAAPFPPADQDAFERTVAVARGHLGEEGFQMAWEAGETMSLEQTIAYALDATESC